MRSCFVSLLSIVFFGLSAAQVKAQDMDKRGIYDRHLPLAIFAEPTALLSLYHSASLRLGVEVPVPHSNISLVPVFCIYPNGNGIKGIAKYYFNNSYYEEAKHRAFNHYSRLYVAVEYFYKNNRYNNSDSIKYPPYGERTYHVEKFATTVSFMIGEVNTFENGLYWDWFVGGGIRVKTVNNDLAEDETDKFYHWHEGMSQAPTDGKVHDGVGPHIALGIRIGWRYR